MRPVKALTPIIALPRALAYSHEAPGNTGTQSAEHR
jgi:hypothetical protein